jgi:hypothetical protein
MATKMVIGETDEGEENVHTVWERAMKIETELGPEPDVEEEEDVVVYKRDQERVEAYRALFAKASLTFATCLVFLLIYIVCFYAMDPGGLGSMNNNIPTQIKVGTVLGMQDASVSPCSSMYARACGTYDKQYTQSSVFQETQLVILNDANAYLPQSWETLGVAISSTPLNLTDEQLADAGYVGCVDVNVDADVSDRTVMAVYLSAPCWESCPPNRHPLPPVLVGNLPEDSPTALRSLVEMVQQSGANVYWLPLNSSYASIDSFVCIHNASSMWSRCVEGFSTYGLANEMYEVDVVVAQPNIDALIATVRSSLENLMLVATFLKTSNTRTEFVNRVHTIPVLYGSDANSVVPRCVVGTPIVDCLTTRFRAQLNAVLNGVKVHPATLWTSSALEVNAYYSPMVDAVYLPSGIMQPPFYSPEWPEWMQMATLGSVIAHELGHAIWPVWSFPASMAPEDTASVEQFENCIIQDEELSGVSEQRAILTLSENWADAISARALLAYTRPKNAQTTRDGLLLWSQMWCAAGSPQYTPLSTDPHGTPFMRVNGTIGSLINFYYEFGCTVDLQRVC